MIHQDYIWFKPRRIGAAGSASVCGTGGREIETHIRHKLHNLFFHCAYCYRYIYRWGLRRLRLNKTMKRDREGSCVSRGSGVTLECAMLCESVPVQNSFYRSRLAVAGACVGNILSALTPMCVCASAFGHDISCGVFTSVEVFASICLKLCIIAALTLH